MGRRSSWGGLSLNHEEGTKDGIIIDLEFLKAHTSGVVEHLLDDDPLPRLHDTDLGDVDRGTVVPGCPIPVNVIGRLMQLPSYW